MKGKKTNSKRLTESQVDAMVESEADDDSAWTKPVRVRRAKAASLTIPGKLAARVEFLAKLHREKKAVDWVTKVIEERVELEELAFKRIKRDLSLRNGA